MTRRDSKSRIDANIDLSPYKVARLTTCWWCGSGEPLTSEHKFKQADLRRMADGGLEWGTDGLSQTVRSIRKSREVRFEPSLCGPCNSRRSQPFDRSYQEFSDFVWETPPPWRRQKLDMADVYGENWPTKTLDLARYFAKHIGCRLAHECYPVPPSLAEFLDGAEVLRDVQMVLFKSRPHYRLQKRAQRDEIDMRGLWLSAGAGTVSRSRNCLSTYSSAFIIGYIGVFYRWELDCEGVDPFYAYRRARLWPRHDLPEI